MTAAPPASDSALVLRRFPFGESSLVLQVLARRHGRVHLIARGAYRPKSRYYAALDLFDTLELEGGQARGRELLNLRGASIRVRRARIAEDLASFRAATTALELAALVARPDQPGEELFGRLTSLLDLLAEPASGVPSALPLAAFELGLLEHLGLAPALAGCAACGAPATAARGRAAFSAGAGGRLCAGCAAEARASGRRVGTMPVAVLAAGRELLSSGSRPSAAATMACLEVGVERVRDLIARFLEYHLEGRPKSYRQFLSVPNRNRPRDSA
jgi:DNA repair protein RecO (recombination protein O)